MRCSATAVLPVPGRLDDQEAFVGEHGRCRQTEWWRQCRPYGRRAPRSGHALRAPSPCGPGPRHPGVEEFVLRAVTRRFRVENVAPTHGRRLVPTSPGRRARLGRASGECRPHATAIGDPRGIGGRPPCRVGRTRTFPPRPRACRHLTQMRGQGLASGTRCPTPCVDGRGPGGPDRARDVRRSAASTKSCSGGGRSAC